MRRTGRWATMLTALLVQSCTVNSACAPAQAHAPANAGCFVVVERQLLVVRDRKSGRLGFPGGTSEPPEPAQCTAMRETAEETGLHVQVDALLAELGSKHYHLYRCVPAPGATLPVAPPLSALLEIEMLDWVNPEMVPASDWRFPDQLPQVLELFRREAAAVPVR